MSQINYAAMSNEELRKYFLQHREDKMALRAYLDRLNELPLDTPSHVATLCAGILGSLTQVVLTGITTNQDRA